MQTRQNLSRSIALIAASLSLLSACGIGYRNTTPIPPPPPPPPLAKLSFSTTALIFGTTVINSSSPPQQLLITNQDATPVIFDSIGTRDYKTAFVIDSANCDQLAPARTCTVNVTFHPRSLGSFRSLLFFRIVGHSQEHVNLSGEGISPPPTTPPSP